MNQRLLEEYRRVRAEYPGISANVAMHWAREALAGPKYPELQFPYRFDGGLEAEVDGFRVVVAANPDYDLSPDEIGLGRFTDHYAPGAIDRKKTKDWGSNQFRFWIPDITYEEHLRDLRKNHARHEADCLARKYVREAHRMAERWSNNDGVGALFVEAKVYDEDGDLVGEESLSTGAIDFDDRQGHPSYLNQIVTDVVDGALAQARKTRSPEMLWERDDIQFPRLAAEAYAVLTPEQIGEMAASMDLPRERVVELFERAEAEFERIKSKLAGWKEKP